MHQSLLFGFFPRSEYGAGEVTMSQTGLSNFHHSFCTSAGLAMWNSAHNRCERMERLPRCALPWLSLARVANLACMSHVGGEATSWQTTHTVTVNMKTHQLTSHVVVKQD